MELEQISQVARAVRSEVAKVVVGQRKALDLMLVGLLCEGHVLLEGPPGTAKTLLTQTFARAVSLDFGRIQFTPDLMPGDVLGTNLFNFQTNEFRLTKGPIFTQLLLADEINRTPPKTQAALLQAMQERIVTIDSQSYELGSGFMVMATQNPIEQQGTYPLPEAQLDRFLFKHILAYPDGEEERRLVAQHGMRTVMPRLDDFGLRPVAGLDDIEAMRRVVRDVRLNEDMVAYVVELIRATREHPAIEVGASPRSAIMLSAAARAFAVLDGRDYVIPDDVKALAHATLRHRIIVSPAAEIEGQSADSLISQLIEQTAAPK